MSIIKPYYQIFKDNLKLVKFKDMKTLFPTMEKFKVEVNSDIDKNGLLCPIVLDNDNITIRSGTHRYEFFKDKYESTLCYIGINGDKTKFFQLLNVFCWKNHPVKQPDFLQSMYEKVNI